MTGLFTLLLFVLSAFDVVSALLSEGGLVQYVRFVLAFIVLMIIVVNFIIGAAKELRASGRKSVASR